MNSHSSSFNHHHHRHHHHHRQYHHRLGFLQSQKLRLSTSGPNRIAIEYQRLRCVTIKLNGSNVRKHGSCLQHSVVQIRAMDEDFGASSFFNDWEDNEGTSGYISFSSEGEDSDGEIVLNPINDIDMPSMKDHYNSTNDALNVTAHRFATLGNRQKKHRLMSGVLLNMGLITFLTTLLLIVDWCSWRIVRLPLAPYYLTSPFFISAALASCTGYIAVPVLHGVKIHQIFRKEGRSIRRSFKKRTPTIGGLFFIPIGIIVAKVLVGSSSVEFSGAAVATAAFASIGLLDDILSIRKNRSNGLSKWIRITLVVAVGTWFSFWLVTTSISSPYGMKMLVPLPPPLGLLHLGKLYLLLTPLCFVSMGNGVNLTDGLDGLAGGTAALAFVGMSIAVLPICPDLSVFGASMAGACVGFLLHNRYRASVFMGDTGSLALGGALAAMAACTGMFFPLFISSGFFILEALSIVLQVSYFKTTRRFLGAGRRMFHMTPFHHHLEMCGFNEPGIVACAYIVSSILALLAGYIGLISA